MSTPIFPDYMSILGSFIFVLSLLGFVLYILKKFQRSHIGLKNNRSIKVIEVLPLSTRQKIMLLEVKDQQILISLSGSQITSLGHWPIEKKALPENLKKSNNHDDPINVGEFSEKSLVATTDKSLSEKKDSSINERAHTHRNEIEKTNDLLVLARKVKGALKNHSYSTGQ